MITRDNICLTMYNIVRDVDEPVYLRQSALDFFLAIDPYSLAGITSEELIEVLLIVLSDSKLIEATAAEKRKFYQSVSAILTSHYILMTDEEDIPPAGDYDDKTLALEEEE